MVTLETIKQMTVNIVERIILELDSSPSLGIHAKKIIEELNKRAASRSVAQNSLIRFSKFS
jgi:hypothetical protein